ncbi:hypothetical protein BDR03DRAFT_978482 [Suillus americanus]|nr:hypothetical protein BDR03DRAFT_978482 [Suillus americanus]
MFAMMMVVTRSTREEFEERESTPRAYELTFVQEFEQTIHWNMSETFRAINESIMTLSLDHYTAMPSHYPRGADTKWRCVYICFLLLGLSLEPKSHRSPKKHKHPLFIDPLFSRFQEWKLSTSHPSAGDQFRGFGAGRMVMGFIHIVDAVRDMLVICEAGELELKDRTKMG